MKIHFYGATQEVTGSCFLVVSEGRRILIECGLIQGSKQDEARNSDAFPFEAKELDAVVLSHAHLDHCGRIPLLVKAGYRKKIYCHPATLDLCQLILKDSGYLNEKDAEWENKKRRHGNKNRVEPLYTMAEAEASIQQFREVSYHETREILPGVQITFRDAGHILGSSILELQVTEGRKIHKVVFSGDLGHYGAPILPNPEIIYDADLVIMESTYGDRNHRSWDSTWDEIGGILNNANASKGNILIPAFAVGRTQELLYTFKKNYKVWGLDQWQIFLDSPMAIESTRIYQKYLGLYNPKNDPRPFSLPNLHMVKTSEESRGLNMIRSGAIIIAGSGMCNGGRIRHHLQHNIGNSKAHVLMVGFQARGTLGRQLVDRAKQIRLWGEYYPVYANVHTIGGLSAHVDQENLLKWYGHFKNRPPIALVHGEEEAINALADKVKNDLGIEPFIPTYGSHLELSGSVPRLIQPHKKEYLLQA